MSDHGRVDRGRVAFAVLCIALSIVVLSATAGCLDTADDDKDGKQPPEPKAKISVDKEDIFENDTIHFSSVDSIGDIKDRLWDFGDGEEGEGEELAHAYAEVGEYRVRLTVVDSKGRSHTDTHFIHVHHYEKRSDAISVLQEKSYVVQVEDMAQGIVVVLTYPTGSVIVGQPSNDLDIELYYPNGTLYLSSDDQEPDTGNYQEERLNVPTQELMASMFRDWKVKVTADTGIEVKFDVEITVLY